jgi:hypothetical protein
MANITFRSDDWLYVKQQLEEKKGRWLEELADSKKSYKEIVKLQGKIEAIKDVLRLPDVAALPRGN